MTQIYCCGCKHEVEARLTDGYEIYPHRPDLITIPFWKCDTCKNYVGCHHKTERPTTPLGPIPTPEIRKMRTRIHNKMDPLWQSGKYKRGQVYKLIADGLGVKRFHGAEITSVTQAYRVLAILDDINVS